MSGGIEPGGGNGWQNYTPTITGSGGEAVYGTGAVRKGRYVQLGSGSGSTVIGWCSFKIGSSPNLGIPSSEWRILLPLTARVETDTEVNVGCGRILDSGATFYIVDAAVNSTVGGNYLQLSLNNIGIYVKHDQPMTWTTNDALYVSFMYEVA